MSNDRYKEIRAALAMGPTPGPFSVSRSYSAGNQELILRLTYKDEYGLPEHYCTVRSRLGGELEAEANAALIAACDPDAIRELLEERDELAKLVAEMRGTLRDLRIHLHAAGRRPEECYEMSMIDDALHLAAIAQARGARGG